MSLPRDRARQRFPGLGAKEYGRLVPSDNGFFDEHALRAVYDQLCIVLNAMPAGAEVLADEIVLFRDGRMLGFYFAVRP